MTAAQLPAPIRQSLSRTTIGSPESPSRTLTYVLSVIQQPERARACGSGAKSSADRRPVDPPPVVELKVYEGEGQNRVDITFAYEANFFLFATLEAARPIARARGHAQAAATPIPVLTGMPVSGMAYLDRPSEAGYFIFPDLSVRHEGTYCLSFNLYEETKFDHDKSDPASCSSAGHLMSASAPDQSFDWRMEVKSSPFTVFSAKKFPGLAESTSLSRTVAEQGCRVRIRRDVRMRRRDLKSGGDADDHPEEEYSRRGREPEQAPFREHTRSPSAETNRDAPVYGGRQPHEQLPGQYPGPSNYVDYSRNPAPQYQAPAQYGPPQSPAPQVYQQPPSSFMPPSQPHYRAPPPPPASYSYDRQYPQSAYPASLPRETYEQDTRRASYAAPSLSYPSVDPGYGRSQYQPQNPPTPAALPPLRLPTDLKHEGLSSPLGPIMPSAHSYPAPPAVKMAIEAEPERMHAYDQYSSSSIARNGKRTFENVFTGTASALDGQRLANGVRPLTNPEAVDDDEDEIPATLVYQRASGAVIRRQLPEYSE